MSLSRPLDASRFSGNIPYRKMLCWVFGMLMSLSTSSSALFEIRTLILTFSQVIWSYWGKFSTVCWIQHTKRFFILLLFPLNRVQCYKAINSYSAMRLHYLVATELSLCAERTMHMLFMLSAGMEGRIGKLSNITNGWDIFTSIGPQHK